MTDPTTPLAAAVAVFRDLGWADASPADALTLPLGDRAQRATAKRGVAAGAWGAFGQIGPRTYGWVSAIGVDAEMFTLFALRQGVPARRAAVLLRDMHRGSIAQAAAAAAEGGDPGAVVRALFPGDGGRHWTLELALRLLAPGDLAPPSGLAYLRAWASFAETHLIHAGGEAELARWRFAEHARAAVAAGVNGAGSPEAGAMALVLARGVELELIGREEAIELGFGGLDAAQRPSDRLAWLETLRTLGVTDADLTARADALVPLLGFGDGTLIELLTPVLLAGDDATAVDTVLVALAAKAKKTRKAVLLAAAARRRPEGAEALADTIAAQASDTDRSVARAAEALASAWALDATAPAAQPVVAAGWWRPTPPVWTVPAFEVPEPTPGALTDAAATLTGRGESTLIDIEVERFWALAVAVAHADPAAARDALRGVRPVWQLGLGAAAAWVRGEPCPYADRLAGDEDRQRTDDFLDLPQARDADLAARLGEVPVLVSTPSRDDLSILPADLIARLSRYREAGVPVGEADLVLAAARLDLAELTEADRAALAELRVGVAGLRRPIEALAGPTLAAYSLDPFVEPPLRREHGWQRPGHPVAPASLAGFPHRLGGWYGADQGIVPAWERSFHAGDGGGSSGAALRQLARRAAPLADLHAADLLHAQHSLLERDPDGAARAALEAFERGLLRPGAAEPALLSETPGSYAALAQAWLDTAQLGLASVVWGALDALVVASLRARRLTPGTAEVVEALAALAPEAAAAVAAGDADASVWALPGVRELATRAGSSRAVTAAKRLVADLPAAPVAAVATPEPAPALDFEAAWPAGVGTAPTVPDGARVRARWLPGSAPQRLMSVQIDTAEASYLVTKKWFYDLEVEGQCQGNEVTTGHGAWLWWDADAGRLAASEFRNRTADEHGPLRLPGPVPPLSVSLVAVALASLCHERETYSARSMARHLGTGSVRLAMAELLASPDISPARIVAALDENPALLPAFWPVLTESIAFAARQGKPPHWLNRVLDAALRHARTLAEASRRGLIPADAAAWPGLTDLAERKGSTAALRKARELRAALGL